MSDYIFPHDNPADVATFATAIVADLESQLAAAKADADRLAASISAVLDLTETCHRCDGTGIDKHDLTSACDRCAGTGKVCEAAIKKAKGEK